MIKKLATTHLAAVAAFACVSSAHVATAKGDPAVRCGRAVALGSSRITKADAHVLTRCVLAIETRALPAVIEEACNKLHEPGLRLDRVDERVRTRILRRCSKAMPPWLPMTCRGPGPAHGTALANAQAVARCVATTAHCTALGTLDTPFVDAIDPLVSQDPQNLAHVFGGPDGSSFLDCLELGPAPTTTTSTTLPPVTTTLPEVTTTLPPVTTTLPPVTTTLPPVTTTLPSGGAPQLVITEIMANPTAQSDAAGEYFELFNAGSQVIDLAGMVVRDEGSDSFTVTSPLVVGAGGYVVLGKSEDAAGGLVDYVYGSGMNLTNSADEIIVLLDDEELDRVAYDTTFPVVSGRAMQLASQVQDATANDAATNWCAADDPLTDGDFGSPGAPGGTCAQ